MAQKETSKRRQQEDSKTGAVSFRLRDVTISMERTSQPEGVRFTIGRKADANLGYRAFAVDGRIMNEANGTILYLDWSGDATVSAMELTTERGGYAEIAIARGTSKSAGAR